MDFLTEIIGTDTKAILKKFKKKEIIQKEGVVSKNAFYVKKGLISPAPEALRPIKGLSFVHV